MIKKHIPNALTCGNVACGSIGLHQMYLGSWENAILLMVIAAVFDFFDGFAARMLNVSSPIGGELDSLADMVTFGVLPGAMMWQMMTNAFPASWPYWLPWLSLMIPVFSALRLAKFNVDTRQSDSFIGLPTTANAPLIASILYISMGTGFFTEVFTNSFVLIVITVVMSLMMTAELPLLALKFKGFQWAGNQLRYILIGVSAVILAVLGFTGVPLVMILYIILSMIKR